jgi:(p)ppGpp synthase/HD superfamily hydrolase
VALLVKAADRLANMQSCITDNKERLLAIYRKEHLFFQKAAFRPGLCDELWDQLDGLMRYRE